MRRDQGHVKILGEQRSGETFVVACHREVDFISHGTVLEDCTIEIRGSGRNIVFAHAVLRRCTIVVARRLTNFRWQNVTLEDCTFRGRFRGCDFGPRPDIDTWEKPGRTAGCDFSGAILHLCRFFHCDINSICLPTWPCFALIDPPRHAAEWLAIPLPTGLHVIQQVIGTPQGGEAASLMDAEELAKEAGMTVDAIRSLVCGLPFTSC